MSCAEWGSCSMAMLDRELDNDQVTRVHRDGVARINLPSQWSQGGRSDGFEDVMSSRHHLSSRQGTSASAAGCRRGGAKRTAYAFQIDPGARRAAGPFLSTDRGACGDPDWEADVAAHAGTAVVIGGLDKIPRTARKRSGA